MADAEVHDLTELSVPALDDELYIVDASSLSDDRKITASRFLAMLGVTPGGRLTLTSGTPVTTSDVTGATTVYYCPYVHDYVTLYDGTRWRLYQFTERSLALGTLTSDLPYDVFLYDNAGTLTLEFLAWTNGTTRATALTRLNGILVKSGATTRRYLGTFYTTATTTTEDSAAKRYLWNQYNRVERKMKCATETTDSWNYSTGAFRQANANTANQLNYVVGDAEVMVEAAVRGFLASTAAGRNCAQGIGVDSTTVNSADTHGDNTITTGYATSAAYKGYPGVGRHFLAWLEYGGGGGGTDTWYGDAGNATIFQSSIHGRLMG